MLPIRAAAAAHTQRAAVLLLATGSCSRSCTRSCAAAAAVQSLICSSMTQAQTHHLLNPGRLAHAGGPLIAAATATTAHSTAAAHSIAAVRMLTLHQHSIYTCGTRSSNHTCASQQLVTRQRLLTSSRAIAVGYTADHSVYLLARWRVTLL
eukprot:17546-Heterococcus_DN1.PRE.1